MVASIWSGGGLLPGSSSAADLARQLGSMAAAHASAGPSGGEGWPRVQGAAAHPGASQSAG
eukprot:14308706-Alexandrium_andersonii.AAC.1